MSQKSIKSLLEKEIGLSADAIGPKTIAKAVRLRMDLCALSDSKAYLAFIRTSEEEWEELVEAVVVPETWYFRNRKSFAYLGRYVKRKWLPEHKDDMLRVLSMASSTGEEPYSIAMALLDSGLSEDRFSIVGVDISKKALDKARRGLYGPESFRGGNLWFRERYFESTAEGYQLHPSVMRAVHFVKQNVVDGQLLAGDVPYEIIFCRNLLIYLTSSAKKRVMEVVERLLAKTGILFVGHAERPLVTSPELELIRQDRVFAFSRSVDSAIPKDRVQPKIRIKFERRDHHQDKSSTSPTPTIKTGPSNKNASIGPAHHPFIDRGRPVNEEVILLDQARKLADEGSLNEAIELCEKCLDQSAVHVQAYFLKGLVCLAMDNEKGAEECLNRTLYLDPYHHEALDHLALIAEHRGDVENAARLRQRVKRIRQREGTH